MYGLARWDGTSWSSLGSGINGSVTALQMHGPDLYAGGAFTTAGGVTAYHVAKWDGTNWSAVGSFDVNNQVAALAFIGDDLYAAGFFLT